MSADVITATLPGLLLATVLAAAFRYLLGTLRRT